MPIIINNISSSLNATEKEVINKALDHAGLSHKINAKIYKTSLDARKRGEIHFVHSVYADLGNISLERELEKKFKDINYAAACKIEPVIGTQKQKGRVCIAGFGPAGIFCALVLAENGYRPIVLERGSNVEKRIEKVSRFWSDGILDANCNVQFGEGGAGTFSDGKLTTRIKDPLCRYVLEQFVKFGAPDEILTKAKPHIGTDNLRNIVKAIREHIISLGGQVFFDTPMTDITFTGRNVTSVSSTDDQYACSALVLAIGHSARDTFELLCSKNIFIEPKPFSVGVRIEHKQTAVDESLYGKYAGNPLLPKGEYQLSAKDKSGRAVYTFCMCPGGTVVPSASEPDSVVTNGMSEFSRSGENANAAVVAAVSPEDYGHSPLDGVEFARKLERRAYDLTGSYKAPAVSVGGFLSGNSLLRDKIVPSYALGVVPCDLRKLFPKFVCDALEFGIHDFSRKMKCFGDPDALMTAPETRTSSPVRITRGERFNSLSFDNLFPCGEGAGYAGGIMSAAVDGIRIALEIMKRFAP